MSLPLPTSQHDLALSPTVDTARNLQLTNPMRMQMPGSSSSGGRAAYDRRNEEVNEEESIHSALGRASLQRQAFDASASSSRHSISLSPSHLLHPSARLLITSLLV